MRILGILGGVAGGKSLVARLLVELGAGLLDADRTGHEVLLCADVEEAARRRWGAEVFDREGRIDRGRLGRVVFGDSPEAAADREYLEQLTHPKIAERLRRRAEAMAAAGAPVAVLDAPLLLEAGWDKLCDVLLFVDAPRRQRLTRALGRGWTEEHFQARQSAQQSLDEKRRRADFVVDNSGTLEQTRVQLERIWKDLLG